MKKTKKKKWTCPICMNSIKSQGKGSHLFSKHGVRSELELAAVLAGQEVVLLSQEPAITTTKQLSKAGTEQPPPETTVEQVFPSENRSSPTVVEQVSETTVEFEHLRKNGTHLGFITDGVYFHDDGSWGISLEAKAKLRELLKLKGGECCFLYYATNQAKGGVNIWQVCNEDCLEYQSQNIEV